MLEVIQKRECVSGLKYDGLKHVGESAMGQSIWVKVSLDYERMMLYNGFTCDGLIKVVTKYDRIKV